MDISKSHWDTMEKEKVSFKVDRKLSCSIKCAANGMCGAALYHQSTGICEMAYVSEHIHKWIISIILNYLLWYVKDYLFSSCVWKKFKVERIQLQ